MVEAGGRICKKELLFMPRGAQHPQGKFRKQDQMPFSLNNRKKYSTV